MNDGIDAPSDDELRKLAKKIIGRAKSQQLSIFSRIPKEARGNYLDERDAVMNSKEHDWVVESFESFFKPSPWEFNDKMAVAKTMANSLGVSIRADDTTLGTVKNLMDLAKGYISNNWHGELSDALAINYFGKMSTDIPENQGRTLLVLHDGLQAMRDMYAATRRNLKVIGEKAVEALDDADGMGITDVKTLLTVLSNVFAIGFAALSAAAPAAAPGLGIASALVAGGFAAGDKAIGDGEDEENHLRGSYPEDVMDKLKEVLEKQRSNLTTKEDELIKCFNQASNQIAVIATNGMILAESAGVSLPYMVMPQGSILTPPIPEVAFTDSDELSDRMFQIDDK